MSTHRLVLMVGLLLVGCGPSPLSGGTDLAIDAAMSPPPDLALDASVDSSSNTGPGPGVPDGFCPQRTPGIVRCGAVDCDVVHGSECTRCTYNDDLRCRPPGQHCNGVFEQRRCDGAEDCPQGEVCYLFEGTWCGKPPQTGTICRCDDDCIDTGRGSHCTNGWCP